MPLFVHAKVSTVQYDVLVDYQLERRAVNQSLSVPIYRMLTINV